MSFPRSCFRFGPMKYQSVIILPSFLPAAKPAGQWMTIGVLDILEILRDRDNRNTGAYVFEVTELISEVSLNLRGRLEAQNCQKLMGTILPQNRRAQTPLDSVA